MVLSLRMISALVLLTLLEMKPMQYLPFFARFVYPFLYSRVARTAPLNPNEVQLKLSLRMTSTHILLTLLEMKPSSTLLTRFLA